MFYGLYGIEKGLGPIKGVLGPDSRVQVAHVQGLWSQQPSPEGFLGPESLDIGYLDPLGQPGLPKALNEGLYHGPKKLLLYGSQVLVGSLEDPIEKAFLEGIFWWVHMAD